MSADDERDYDRSNRFLLPQLVRLMRCHFWWSCFSWTEHWRFLWLKPLAKSTRHGSGASVASVMPPVSGNRPWAGSLRLSNLAATSLVMTLSLWVLVSQSRGLQLGGRDRAYRFHP